MKKLQISDRKKFFLNIIIPTLLTEALFVVLIFAIIIPQYNSSLIDAKKEMIRELINASLCIADNYYLQFENGELSKEDARRLTISTLKSIRYGADNKDYIWITDGTPIMIMHPYRRDLIEKNVANFTDPNGKKMFTEMVNKAKVFGDGFVDYKWQWMDDSSRIVPKISYIKKCENWDWIIGTGVYIEDIRESIAGVVNSLIWTSLGIFAAVSFFLIVVVRENLKVDRKRNIAEQNLKESNEKYKALVEESADGTLMFVDNKCIFRNKKFDELIGNISDLILIPNISNLIDHRLEDDIARIDDFLKSSNISFRLETIIVNANNKSVNVLLSYSKVSFSDQTGVIITIKDLSLHKEDDVLSILLSDAFSNVAEKLNIGVFRTAPDRKGRLSEVNKQFMNILGYNSREDILSVNIFNLFDDTMEMKEFISTLYANGFVKEFNCRIAQQDGTIINLLVSAVLIRRDDDSVEHIDGIITDFSRQKRGKERRDKLLAKFVNHHSIWDLPVTELNLQNIPISNLTITFEKAFELMDFYSTDVIIAKEEKINSVFVVSKDKILNLIKSSNFRLQNRINCCIIANDILLDNKSTATDCLLDMIRNKRSYSIFQTNNSIQLIRLSDLAALFGSNVKLLTDRLKSTTSIDEIIDIHNDLPLYISQFVSCGTNIGIITETITSVSDEITKKIIKNAINLCGQPPASFAFVALGSEGRREQGLSTDQDNAIIIENIDNQKFLEVKEYFLRLANIINELLFKSGYSLCSGEIMANNSRWNVPIETWKQYYHKWITVPEPQSLIDSSIFFDFRCIYGDDNLTSELRNFIQSAIANNPRFLTQMAMLNVNYKLPVGMFGKIQTETKEEQSNKFNLKNALRLLVNIVRLYAMKFQLNETNTIARLEEIYEKNYISLSFYSEISYCFAYLMNLQFANQTDQYSKGNEPNNYIDLSVLNTIELANLKNVLSNISSFQNKVKYDFGVTNV